MSDLLTAQGHVTGRTAEQQMRRWALGLQIGDRLTKKPTASELASQIHPYVAISRETGSGGSEVADRLGRQIEWQILDRELLVYMAQEYKLPSDMLQFVDETTSNWLLELFGKWLNHYLVTQAEYVSHLGHIVLLAAGHERSIFVGRGAQFLLPPEKGFAVQIIAPREMRIERIAKQHAFTHDKAAEYVDEHDRGRHDFVKKYFRQEVSDPHVYDMVINLARTPIDEAVNLIASQAIHRFGRKS